MVYLSSSKVSYAVLGNLGLAVALALYKLMTKLFLGSLRDSEIERINDRISQVQTSTRSDTNALVRGCWLFDARRI